MSVQRPAGAVGTVHTVTEGADLFVYPDDAAAYVAADVLDKRLFNITQLIAQGYDDTHSPRLPLIFTHNEGSSLRRSSASLPGIEVTRNLTSVHGEAVSADRPDAARFWSALTRPANSASEGGKSSRAVYEPPFAGGIDKIWLDGKSEATLADTTAQIGAPQVWHDGGIGSGVKLAVLDTGIDAGHPDLADRIVGSRSFIPGQDVIDRDGHGTHTASTAVGTGAASDGREKGVAPGADLVVGKVLDDDGVGQDSWIIAGMEWAARTEHAKVISMSLGNRWLNDGTDPMSQSLNALSAETDSLFVVAAGNAGPGAYTVSSPGTAEAALTVGAVDSADRLAVQSSVGPRKGDDGLKPDLTAPGVNVLAARSQYSSEGEGYYLTLSGTSMATPHVAGAAALLAEKHPDWTAGQLKDALMSTSKQTPSYAAYQAGAGRVDVAAGAHGRITATGSVFGGQVRWSKDTPQPVKRQITYTNTGDNPVSLNLSVDQGQSAAGLFTLPTDQVSVEAHGTAKVDVVADPAGLAAGGYTSQVIARDPAGTIIAHTVAGISVEAERYDLRLTMKDRAGRPMAGVTEIKGAAGGSTMYYQVPDTGKLTLRMAPDTYSVMTYADVEGTHGPHSRGVALLGDPEVELTADRDVALDASEAHQVRALTPKPTALVNTRLEYYRSFTAAEPTPKDGRALVDTVMVPSGYDSVWAQPTGAKVKHGSFVFTTRLRAEETPLDVSYGGVNLDDALVQRGSRPLPNGTSRLDAVFAGTGSPAEYAELTARGKLAVVRRSDDVPPAEQAAAAAVAGAKLLLVVNDGMGRRSDWYGQADQVTPGPASVASLTHDEGEVLIDKITSARNHAVRLRVEAHVVPSYLYDLSKYHVGAIPQDVTFRADSGSLARIDLTFAPPSGIRASETRLDYPPYLYAAGSSFAPEPVASGTRTDWVSTDDHAKWQQTTWIPGWMGALADPVSYEPGSTHKDRWFAPVIRPRMLESEPPTRDETSVSMVVRGFGDSGTAHTGDAEYGTGMSKTVSLYQGDKQLLRTDNSYVYAYDLAPEPLPYRLVVDTVVDPEFSPYPASTHTEWEFTSGSAATGTVVPLVQLDYGTDLNFAGQSGRRAEVSVTPSVLGGNGQMASVTLEISYDNGVTWQQQNLWEKKGAWRTRLRAPASASAVSLRTTVKDRTGGSVTQTVIRAFGLK